MNDIKTLIFQECSVSDLNNLPIDLENLIIVSITSTEQELKTLNLPLTLKTLVIGNINHITINTDKKLFVNLYENIKLPLGCVLIVGENDYTTRHIFTFKFINNFNTFLCGTFWSSFSKVYPQFPHFSPCYIHFNEFKQLYYFYINY